MGLPSIEIPRYRPTAERDPDYRHYYTRASRRIVERSHAAIIKRFDYAF
jgi:hypothetical protein